MSYHNYIPLEVLYEDNHIIAINKPAGILSDSDRTGDETMADQVKAYIKDRYNKPGDVFLGIPHRLDRPTSGVIIYARTSKALERINEMLKERKLKKTYWAITIKRPPEEEGTLRNFLLRQLTDNTSKVVKNLHGEAKEAILHYKLELSRGKYHLLEINLETGRHHQIRAQLSNLGCPIVGDRKYGYPEANEDGSICLHARQVEFIHPVKKEPMVIVAPTPQTQIWKTFR